MNLYGLTLLLILLPPQDPIVSRVGTPSEWRVLKDLAYLLDLYELEGNWANDYEMELNWVRKRWREAYSSPPLAQVQRLPSELTIIRYLEFNQLYLEQLQHYRSRKPWLDWDKYLIEAQELRTWWETARLARQQSYTTASKRKALQQLEELDPIRFWSGQWPAHVPIWQFGK